MQMSGHEYGKHRKYLLGMKMMHDKSTTSPFMKFVNNNNNNKTITCYWKIH